MKKTIVALLGCILCHPAVAQDVPRFDGALAYSARHTIDRRDNDIFRLTAGYSWSAMSGRIRTAVELGVDNEDFSGSYPANTGLEVDFARRVGDNRFALGARLRHDDQQSTTAELAYGIQHFGTALDWRGVVGFQGVADHGEVDGRDGASAFGIATATIWLDGEWAVDAGLEGDSDGLLYTIGTEYRPQGSAISLFALWGHAVDEYRGKPQYNDLTAGIRVVPARMSLRSFRRGSLSQIFSRAVEVQ
ncbi:MAG: hypothetical protein ACK5IB_05965 [Qingshengfaniella sp.]